MSTQKNSCTILKKLFNLQQEFKSTKDNENKFGNFKYRSFESMMTKLKPLLDVNGLILTFSESMKEVGGEVVMDCVGTLTDIENGDSYTSNSSVVVDKELKGMCRAQASGSAISYIRKYNLCGMLGVDDGSTELDGMNFNNLQSNTPTMIERIDACQTTKELNTLYKNLTQEEQQKWLACFSFRKKKLIAK